MFERRAHTIDGVTRDVWVAGAGPGVLVMHEIPGLHPGVIQFGEELVGAGFTVWMPDLFGVVGKPVGPLYLGSTLLKVCVSREFALLRAGRNSPITNWLRGLARALAETTGGRVGALGMCLTGGFALALMVDDCVGAPVLSQPSLPFGMFPFQRSDLGIDAPTLARVKERCAEGTCVLGLRFSGDPMVPRARFDRLAAEVGDRFERVDIPSGAQFWKHAVLTLDRHEPSVQRVIAFFREHTGAPPRR